MIIEDSAQKLSS